VTVVTAGAAAPASLRYRPSTEAACERWAAYWSDVRNRRWLAARELIELSPRLVDLYADRVRVTACEVEPAAGTGSDGGLAELWLYWDSAAEYALQRAGLSGGERRLAGAVAALTTEHCWLDVDDLDVEGTWTDGMWCVLVQWASAGRLTVTEASEPAAWLDQCRGWALCRSCAELRGIGAAVYPEARTRPENGAVCGECGETCTAAASDDTACQGGSR
jgi:hypothetical protein